MFNIKMPKIDLNKFYKADGEIRVEPGEGSYRSMYRSINTIFDFNTIGSFIDLGCATGHLIKNIKANHSTVTVKGVEYFQYHKDSPECSDLIKDAMVIADLRDDLEFDEKYDIVYSTEVAEHIDPAYADMYMRNILKCAKPTSTIIMSWAAGKIYSQHFNPKEYDEFINYVSQFGLRVNVEKTNHLLHVMMNQGNVYPWYFGSMTVFNLGEGEVKIPKRILNTEFNLISHVDGNKLILKRAIIASIFEHDFDDFEVILRGVEGKCSINGHTINPGKIILNNELHFPKPSEEIWRYNVVDKSLIPDVLQPQIVFSEPHGSLDEAELIVTNEDIKKIFNI